MYRFPTLRISQICFWLAIAVVLLPVAEYEGGQISAQSHIANLEVGAGTTVEQQQPGDEIAPLPKFHFSLAPQEDSSPNVEEILDVVEGLCRFTSQHLDQAGAVIDPFLKREHQYSTPYFAHAVGTLMHFDRARDLWPAGIKAMDHATDCFAGGSRAIPDRHGEFFIAPLASSLEFYKPHVSEDRYQDWQDRLCTPLTSVMQNQHGRFNNWRTYGMKGEWIRAQLGLADRTSAEEFITDAWLNRTQRDRIVNDRWNFYQDWSSDPQSHAVEAVGRGNLLALVEAGYDGPWSEQITRVAERGTTASLLWQDASGQLDGSIFYTINENVKIGVQAVNLLNETTVTRAQVDAPDGSGFGDRVLTPRSYFSNDRRFTFIARFSF